MFEIYRFSEREMILATLVLLRMSACVMAMPILGAKDVPGTVKVLISLLMTLLIFGSHRIEFLQIKMATQDLIVLAAREVFVGLFIGFLSRAIFWGVEVAGQILGFSMGLSAAQVFNPTTGDSSTIIEQFQIILAMLLFLAINGHHWLIQAISKSFELAPLAQVGLKTDPLLGLGGLIQNVFGIGIKIAGPMMAVIIFVNIGMGVVGRAVPQVNVFVVSFAVNILVGLFVFMVTIPLILSVLEVDFSRISLDLLKFIKAF